MYLSITILLSGIVAGFILFQSAINAPLLFKNLSIDQARPVLRGLFPVLFRVNAALGILILGVGYLLAGSLVASIAGAVTLMGSVICVLLVPATNRAADNDNQAVFNRLHRISVLLTMLVLLTNLVWMFF